MTRAGSWGLVASLLALSLASTGCHAALGEPFTPPEAGGAAWVEIRTPHFDVYSDLPAADARAEVLELERMYATLLDVGFPYEAKPRERTRAVLFQREAEYQRVAPFGSAGVFNRAAWLGGDGPEPLAMIHGELTLQTRAVLQHELTHRFVRFYYPKTPAWMNEGFAHYFETLSLEDGYAVLGKPTFHFTQGTRWAPSEPGKPWSTVAIPRIAVPPAHALLQFQKADIDRDRHSAGARQTEWQDQQRTTANRAGAWAFVHLLMTGSPAYRAAGATLFGRLGKGDDFAKAWAEASRGLDPATLDADLAASLSPMGREVALLRARYTPADAPVESERAMSPAEVHLLWAALRHDRTAAEIEAALRLAPDDPAALRARAHLRASAGAFDGAAQDLSQALAKSPEDTRVLFDLFVLDAARAGMKNAPPSFREQAEALLPRLLPRVSSAYMEDMLARALSAWGRADEALALSIKSYGTDASCWRCYDTLALLLAKRGAPAKAVEAEQLALDLMPEDVSSEGQYRHLHEYRAAAAKAPAVETEGNPLSEAVVRTILKRRRDAYQRCYTDGLGRNPALEGQVVARFVLELDGVPQSVTDGGSTLPDKQVVACVLEEVGKLRFPQRESGSTQTVVHPLTFAPAPTTPPAPPAKP